MKFKFYTVKKGKEEYIHITAKTKTEALNIMKTKYPENKIRQTIIEANEQKSNFPLNLSNSKLKKFILTPLVAIGVIGIVIFFYSKFDELVNNKGTNISSFSDTDFEDPINKPDSNSQSEEELNSLGLLEELVQAGYGYSPGSYIKGDIPTGEYAYIPPDERGKYYVEKDIAGNIIDNENFRSFGYVFVHGEGNLQTDGYLISLQGLEQKGYSGSKELYEEVNNLTEYTGSGYYKVGKDLPPGQYVIESLNKAYVAIKSGPIGKSDILENQNFNGRYSVNIMDGQYLQVSNGSITYISDAKKSNDSMITSGTPTEKEITDTLPSDKKNTVVIPFPEDSLAKVLSSSDKNKIEVLYIVNEVHFSLEGLGEMTNLREIHFEDIHAISHLRELLDLPNLQRIYIGNTDGDTSVEMFLRQWGLSRSIDYIYPDGTRNFW